MSNKAHPVISFVLSGLDDRGSIAWNCHGDGDDDDQVFQLNLISQVTLGINFNPLDSVR